MLWFCVLSSSYPLSGLRVELFPFKVIIINLDLLECCKFIAFYLFTNFIIPVTLLLSVQNWNKAK